MQFLVLNERNFDDYSDADFTPEVVAPEGQRVKELYGQSFIRQIWHRGDVPGGCILVEADSEADARDLLGTLPLVAKGMVRVASIVPLKPFSGFAA